MQAAFGHPAWLFCQGGGSSVLAAVLMLMATVLAILKCHLRSRLSGRPARYTVLIIFSTVFGPMLGRRSGLDVGVGVQFCFVLGIDK